MRFVKDMGKTVYRSKDEKSTREGLTHPIMKRLRMTTRAPKIQDSRRGVSKS